MEPNVQPKALSTSEKIRVYAAKHPTANAKETAKAVGVKPTLVYAVRKYDRDRKARLKTNKKAIKPFVPVIKVEEATLNQHRSVFSPPHYMVGGIETIKFIEAKLTKQEFLGYLKGNIIKYSSRIGHKDDAAIDAGKLAWYAAKLRSVLNGAA